MSKRYVFAGPAVLIPLVCCLLTFLALAAHAAGPNPWEPQSSIQAALALQDGQNVTCEGVTVERIAARSNPAYIVVRDSFHPESAIAVVCRPPAALRPGNVVDVHGVIRTLPSGERYIEDPTISGYVNELGQLSSLPPMFPFMPWNNKQVLAQPTGPIASSDPSLPDDGLGIASAISALATAQPTHFDSVASLLDASPAVLSRVQLECKPLVGTGEGFVVVGDDNSQANVKVYTNLLGRTTDRLVRLSATVHTEDGSLVLYADDGPTPYFDPQGSNGSVLLAQVGTLAYAATLPDSDDRAQSGGFSIMSTTPSTGDNDDWVYLTGQVVTYAGQYYSYDLSQWVNVYNIEGLDRASGMRVWYAPYSPSQVGSVVDLMAKLDTKDGQRLLGKWILNTLTAVDLTSNDHSLEPQILAPTGSVTSLPSIAPLGINNRDLGGQPLGSNPGVTGAQGLYNVGSLVTVWGKVLDVDDYPFDQYGTAHMVIDDGSGTATDNQDVTIFGYSTYGPYEPVSVDDYISVTGVSSVWKPSGSSTTHRCVWASGYAMNQIDPYYNARTVTDYGTISGNVKLYDMPDATATVTVYSTCGLPKTLTVNRGQDNSGTASFSWEDVPSQYDSSDPIEYIVSAHCPGYKTRSYTQVVPDNTRNLYLTRLRKIYVTAGTTFLGPCSGTTSTPITATVVDADRAPIAGQAVRFRTNKGSFSSSSIVHDYTPVGTTNAQGQVTATYYARPSEWGDNDIVVEATDDSAPLQGDALNDDPYKYDWQQVHDQYGQPVKLSVEAPTVTLDTLTANPTVIAACGSDMSTITATVKVCGTGEPGQTVTFTTDLGVFDETGTSSASATTNASGVATAHLKANANHDVGTATVTATANVYGIVRTTSPGIQVMIAPDKLALTANPYSVTPSQSSSTITAKLTTPTNVPIVGRHVTFTTTAGTLTNITPASGDTNSSGEVCVTLSGVSQGAYAVIEATSTDRCDETIKQRCQVDFLQSTTDDWPSFMHDTRHQGYSRFYESDPPSADCITYQWARPVHVTSAQHTAWYDQPLGGKTQMVFEHPYIDSSPVHASGCPVIVGGYDGDYYSSTGYVKAFNATTGADVWTYSASGTMGGVASTPCVADIGGAKRVYFGSTDGKLYALTATNGAAYWAQPYQTLDSTGGNGKILASPTVYDGRIYITNESSTVYCLNAGTGALIWSHTLPRDGTYPDSSGLSSPAIGITAAGEYRLYVGSDTGHVYCLSIADSPQERVIWDYAGEDGQGAGCVESSPTIYAGNVYVGTSWMDRDLLALDATDGHLLWYQGLDEEARATAAAADGHVYIGVDTGYNFWKVQAAFGNRIDTFALSLGNYFVGSAALCSGGLAFVGNDNGNFYARRQSSLGTSLAAYTQANGVICSSPAISYVAQSNYRWVYILSRGDKGRGDGQGTLIAFRELLDGN